MENILKEEYKDDMTLEELTKLCVKCLVKSLEARNEVPRIKLAVIPATTKKLKMLSDEEIDKYMKSI